jgi:predicted chitinase
MQLDTQLLTSLGVTSTRADKYFPDLHVMLQQYHIDTPLRVAHFLAQVLHESGGMRLVEENMNYSAERLLEIFPTRFTPTEAQAYARKPEMIANRVYGGRMGNGGEASGDGYRYRGRGLLQLTGKENYHKFSQWIHDDVVADPDLVAHKYPAHSAVYFWTSKDLNALADVDDVKEVTRKVNGGFNGLAERIALLNKAKALLAADAPLPVSEGVTHRVTATTLNLRSRPEVDPSNVIGSLAQGTEVMKLADSDVPGWVKVQVVLNGQMTEGFVASRYLRAISQEADAPVPQPPPPIEAEMPAVHLAENRRDITRARDGGQAYPLGEADSPRRSSMTPDGKAGELLAIIQYLDSENRAHGRYWPKSGTTYCNIYAYDYCYLAGVYLPRVWWTDMALLQIRDGQQVPITYGETVREVNANMLHDWFEEHGPAFGWTRVHTLDGLQEAANKGEVCIIVAQQKDRSRSGHIVAVIPEHEEFIAARNAAGGVVRPVESQAGVQNHRCCVKPSAWWMDARYRSFGFWQHA